MKSHESSEDYLETIYVLNKRNGQVRPVDVAKERGFSRPSITNAMKLLRSRGYVADDSSGNLTLTPKGEELAARVYNRHIVLTEFLIQIGVNDETAREDACRLEHVLSEESFSRITDLVNTIREQKREQ